MTLGSVADTAVLAKTKRRVAANSLSSGVSCFAAASNASLENYPYRKDPNRDPKFDNHALPLQKGL